jgi:hypothetical protein
MSKDRLGLLRLLAASRRSSCAHSQKICSKVFREG